MTTTDGYVLGIHRVPHGKGEEGSNVVKQPVLLAHGMLASSAQWIFGPPDNSLGFLLADEGTVRMFYKCFMILDHFIHLLKNRLNQAIILRDSSFSISLYPVT